MRFTIDSQPATRLPMQKKSSLYAIPLQNIENLWRLNSIWSIVKGQIHNFFLRIHAAQRPHINLRFYAVRRVKQET